MLQLSVCLFKSDLILDIKAELHDVGLVLFIKEHYTLSQDMSPLREEKESVSESTNQSAAAMTTDQSVPRNSMVSVPTSGSVKLVTVLW